MYISYCVNKSDKPEVKVKTATNYENRGDGWKDYESDTEKWLSIDIGANMVNIRLTKDQLNAIYLKLGALLQDQEEEARLKAIAEQNGFKYDPSVD